MYTAVVYHGAFFRVIDQSGEKKLRGNYESDVHHIAVNTDKLTLFGVSVDSEVGQLSRSEFFQRVHPARIYRRAPDHYFNMMPKFEALLADALWVRVELEAGEFARQGGIEVPCYECHQKIIPYFNSGNYRPIKAVQLFQRTLLSPSYISSYRVGRCECGTVYFAF